MRSRRTCNTLIGGVLGTLLLLTALASPAVAQGGPPFYASCVRCHTLTFAEAQGQMDVHAGFFMPEFPEGACSTCHDTWFHEQDPLMPPFDPYWWWTPVPDPSPLPPGPSVTTQLCESCHDGFTASAPHQEGTTHPYDQIPYFPPVGQNPPVAPPSILPLFLWDGYPAQDPSAGGVVCSTCHDAHDPSYRVFGLHKFLRVGWEEDTTTLCTTCHVDQGPPPYGHDLAIAKRSDSIAFWTDPATGRAMADVTVTNRGTAPSLDSWMWVDLEEESGMFRPLASVPLPVLAPDEVHLATFPLETQGIKNQEVLHFVLDPSMMNPAPGPKEYLRRLLPAPENLRVVDTGTGDVTLAWNPPMSYPLPMLFNVYRNGQLVNTAPLGAPSFQDTGLAPGTPHTYTVQGFTPEGRVSASSNRVGARTAYAAVLDVPTALYPTIQHAISAAGPGTIVRVAAGIYQEELDFTDKGDIAVVGQDAAGCVLDLTGLPVPELDLAAAAGPVSFGGFTIRGGTVSTSPPATLFSSVIQQPLLPALEGGGFITNTVFDDPGPGSVSIPAGDSLTIANTVFLAPDYAVLTMQPPATGGVYLINNVFSGTWEWMDYPGEGNLTGDPKLDPAYFPDPAFSPCIDAGADVGLPYMFISADIGVFEDGLVYTPGAPADLAGTWQPGTQSILLDWTLSPNDPFEVQEYRIYRSELQGWPAGTEESAYATVLAGTGFFEDLGVEADTTYYYRVRAMSGDDAFVPAPILSLPSNTVSVSSFNTSPEAVDDTAATPEDTDAVIDVLANDDDPDPDTLSVTGVTQPANGTAAVNLDDTVTYSPGFDFFGSDSFTYSISDGRGGVDTATVTVTVDPVNDAPRIDDPGTQANVEGEGILLTITFTDPDSSSFTYGATGLPPDLAVNPLTGRIEGTLTYESAGTWFVDYTVDDGIDPSTLRFTWEVQNTNRSPQFTSYPPLPLSDVEGALLSYQFTAVDPDGDPVTYSAVNFPPDAVIDSSTGLVTGTLTYDSAGYYDSPGVVASDGARTNTLYFQWTVANTNRPPTADPDSYGTDEDAALAVAAPGVLGNDTDPDGEGLTAVLDSDAAHGTVTLNGNGSFTYEPDANFFGSDSFTYTATDGDLSSPAATVTIAVTRLIDDIRVASIDMATAPVRNKIKAVAEVLVLNELDAPLEGVSVDGSWTFVGQPEDSVLDGPPDLTAADGRVSFDSMLVRKPVGTFTFTVDAVVLADYTLDPLSVTSKSIVYPPPEPNEPPVADDDTASTTVDTPVVIDVLANDSDPNDDPLTIDSVTEPANGTASTDGATATYTPDPGFLGNDTFGYTVSDGNGGTVSATVSVSVTDTPAGGVMHVADIAMSVNNKKVVRATAAVTVVDALGAPVPNATVHGDWSGAVSGPDTGLTDGSGVAELTSPGKKGASGQTFTFTVTNIVLSGWSYDDTANVETSDSIPAP